MLAGISMTLSPLSLISHLRLQSPSIGAERANGSLQRPGQRTAQTRLPTRPLVVQVSAPPRGLSGWVDVHPLRTAHDPDQRALRENLPTPYTGPLRNVPGSLSLRRRHRSDLPPGLRSSPFPGVVATLVPARHDHLT